MVLIAFISRINPWFFTTQFTFFQDASHRGSDSLNYFFRLLEEIQNDGIIFYD